MKLKEALERYIASDMVSFHMPGHKGRLDPMDVTELPGLDDLYAPEGMLRDALERAAAVYGADRSFYLVNGSTVGVLSAVSAAVKKGGCMIMQRASHKSAYHAAILRDIKLSYIYEDCDPYSGAGCGVSLDSVKRAVEEEPRAEAVFITSPSYEGFTSDVAAIAGYLHERGIKLIVDAAHGAHFALSEEFPRCAVDAGADLVVMSLHKTLPCPNQSALLHIRGDLVEAGRVSAFLSVYQTTSPSYPMMAAMDDCITAAYDWQAFVKRRRYLSDSLKGLKNIRIRDAYSDETGHKPEPCKLLLCPEDSRSGIKLHEELRRHKIEPEMSLPGYVLLICSIYDTDEDYDRLIKAVKMIDKEWAGAEYSAADYTSLRIRCVKDAFAAMDISKAWEAGYETVPLSQAVGRISAASVMAYPPGRPVLVPGEPVTEESLEEISKLYTSGCVVKGVKGE